MGEKTIIVNVFQRKMVIIWVSVIFFTLFISLCCHGDGSCFYVVRQSVSRNNRVLKGLPFPYSSK